MSAPTDIRHTVRRKYGQIATGKAGGCGCGCSADSSAVATEIGYTKDQLSALPEGANLGLGCGNPLEHAGVRRGETVLDLGSGAGMDVFIASREVGPEGRVIGVDMTPDMIEKARANAAKAGVTNVEFRLGEIEHLPVADGSVDVIISNCVINLSPDKPQVFREAFRALAPGGRLMVSDLVLLEPLPEQVRNSVEAYVGCVAGASLKEEYLDFARAAGFTDVAIVEERSYGEADLYSVRSVKVRGSKPAA